MGNLWAGDVVFGDWLIDESEPPDEGTLSDAVDRASTFRGRRRPALAVRLNDVVIHDTRKWFGGADIRLDAIVVRGLAEPDGASDGFYQPTTFRFSGIRDGDSLPIEPPGLLVFYGQPLYFLDLSVLVSRDRNDSLDLAELLANQLNSEQWKAAAGSLVGLVAAAPSASAVASAIGGAAVVANLAARVLGMATGDTIGLYRTSWLQYRDRFGLGRHPEDGSYKKQDLSFWYEVVIDRAIRPAT